MKETIMSGIHDNSDAMGNRQKRQLSGDTTDRKLNKRRQSENDSLPMTHRCPFSLNDPEHKCAYKYIPRLKQHIQRTHTRPCQCDRCGFRGDAGQLKGHKSAKRKCEKKDFEKVSEGDLRTEKYMETHPRFSSVEISKILPNYCPRHIEILRWKEDSDSFGESENPVPRNLRPTSPFVKRYMSPDGCGRVESAKEHDQESPQPNIPNMASEGTPCNLYQPHCYSSSHPGLSNYELSAIFEDEHLDAMLGVGNQQIEGSHAGFTQPLSNWDFNAEEIQPFHQEDNNHLPYI